MGSPRIRPPRDAEARIPPVGTSYPSLKICVEYDGQEFHTSDEAKESDRKRRKWLRDHGWIVIVVTKDDFRGPALDRWLHELREAVAERTN